MTEAALMGGMLEPTNSPYGVAKIAGIKLCESYNLPAGALLPQRHAHQPLRPR
jgi:nucleoside-diphosphate-sugar epimerase